LLSSLNLPKLIISTNVTDFSFDLQGNLMYICLTDQRLSFKTGLIDSPID
jgi:hypothetical protein